MTDFPMTIRAARAAIEADVLRRTADRFQRQWPVYGDDWLRAEADRIEEGARSTDTPRPERVTLSDEDVALLAEAAHCAPDKQIMAALAPAIERILAVREQALREEIAQRIETLRPDAAPSPTSYRAARTGAARIARGETR